MINADGSMPLVEHLRELQSRLLKAALAVLIGSIVGWYFFEAIFAFLKEPYESGIASILAQRGLDEQLAIGGVGGAFSFRLKIAVVCGIIGSSPFWIWQMWAFILPAMHRHERRWAFILTLTGAPLFLGGVALGYTVLPKAIEVLIGFVPDSVDLILTLGDYLDFVVRMLLVFGVAAEIPLVVVMLNRLGIVSAKQLAASRAWIIIGIFVFAAIATPSTDPLTMLFLAAPMTVLYLISEVIARLADRKRSRETPDTADDDASELDVTHDGDDDDTRSVL